MKDRYRWHRFIDIVKGKCKERRMDSFKKNNQRSSPDIVNLASKHLDKI